MKIEPLASALQEVSLGPPRTIVEPSVTVIVTVFNAERDVAELVEMILAQRNPGHDVQSSWLRVIFIDDCSQDKSYESLCNALEKHDWPPHIRALENQQNLGLAASLNRALLECETQFILTCQSDCRFVSQTYVAEMIALMKSNPHAAAITGQPVANQPIAWKEKINLVENIQDILPPAWSSKALRPVELHHVGFAEGRADIFRLEAIRKAGYYDANLRISGEDQVLSGRFRELGYGVYQAPHLTYVMSLSSQQDSIRGMLRKQYVWGSTHPYILLLAHETVSGVIGKKAGSNRRLRVLLRSSQVAATMIYVLAAWSLFASHAVLAGAALGAVALIKAFVFRQHLKRVKLSFSEFMLFAIVQPAFDICYTAGLAVGLAQTVGGGYEKPLASRGRFAN